MPQTTVWQYTHGVPDTTRVSPDGYGLDNYYLARSGADEIQLDLFFDYASNVALYPAFHEYFRQSRPPLLAVWGKNDPFFLPAGAKSLGQDALAGSSAAMPAVRVQDHRTTGRRHRQRR
jgi:hypothetical protein